MVAVNMFQYILLFIYLVQLTHAQIDLLPPGNSQFYSAMISRMKTYQCSSSSEFCASAPLENNGTSPTYSRCCWPCSCGINCLKYGTCCLDVVQVDQPEGQGSCKHLDNVYVGKPVWNHIMWNIEALFANYDWTAYYIIDTCRENMTGDMNSCSIETYEDLTPTLDLKNNRLYKNKKCAMCNGAKQVIALKVSFNSCFSGRSSGSSPFAVMKHLTEMCQMVIDPPIGVDWNLECFKSKRLIVNCKNSNTDISAYHDWGTAKNFCKNDTFIYPYFGMGGHIYDNSFCYMCHTTYTSILLSAQESCAFRTSSSNVAEFKTDIPASGFQSRSFIASVVVEKEEYTMESCDEDNLFYNEQMDRCQELLCPFFHHAKKGVCERYIVDLTNKVLFQVIFQIVSREVEYQQLTQSRIIKSKFIDLATQFFAEHFRCEQTIDMINVNQRFALSIKFKESFTCNENYIRSFFYNFGTPNKIEINIMDCPETSNKIEIDIMECNYNYSFILRILHDTIYFESYASDFDVVTVVLNPDLFYCVHLALYVDDLTYFGLPNDVVEQMFVKQRNITNANGMLYLICLQDYISLLNHNEKQDAASNASRLDSVAVVVIVSTVSFFQVLAVFIKSSKSNMLYPFPYANKT